MGEKITSPFARHHLFRNPFGELTGRERAELAVVEVEEYLDWLDLKPSEEVRPAKLALQFIGPCGHGKSTHLLALQWAIARSGAEAEMPALVYFPEEGDQPALPSSRPLLIDEAQRMGWWRRQQLLGGTGPVIIGTHNDMSGALASAGFRVRTVDLSRSLTAERLCEMLNRRIDASRMGNAHPASSLCLTLEQVVVLQERFGSNIRTIEDHLYLHFQRFVLRGEPWLPVA